jgi:hypothetical protein
MVTEQGTVSIDPGLLNSGGTTKQQTTYSGYHQKRPPTLSIIETAAHPTGVQTDSSKRQENAY